MDNLSTEYMQFTFYSSQEDRNDIILRINLTNSSVHFFNPESDIKDRRVYKSYLYYQVIEQWYNEDTENIDEEILLNACFDECSAIIDYSLGEQLDYFNDNYKDYNFSCNPLGDGVSWYFKKEFFPDYCNKAVTEEFENLVREGKAHYPITEQIKMLMCLDCNGSAFTWNFSKEQFESFIQFLFDVKDYFYEHPEPI